MIEDQGAGPSDVEEPISELSALLREALSLTLRQGRFLAFGVLVGWGIVLLLHLVLPRQHVVEMTLRFPDVPWAPAPGAAVHGLSPGTFKLLQRSLANVETLQSYIEKLEPGELRVLRDADSVFLPLASGMRNEINRLLPGDTVIGARFSFTGEAPARLQRIAGAYAQMARDALVTLVAQDRLESQILDAETALARAWAEYRARAMAEREYPLLLQQLESTLQGSREGEAREIVDVQGGKHVYLTGPAQIRGVRAQRSEGAYQMRVALAEVHFQQTRLTLYRQLRDHLAAKARESSGSAVRDVVSLAEADMSAFLKTLGDHPEERYNEVLLGGLSRGLREFASGLSEVQQPQVTIVPRLSRVLLAGLFATALVVLAAVVRDRASRP